MNKINPNIPPSNPNPTGAKPIPKNKDTEATDAFESAMAGGQNLEEASLNVNPAQDSVDRSKEIFEAIGRQQSESPKQGTSDAKQANSDLNPQEDALANAEKSFSESYQRYQSEFAQGGPQSYDATQELIDKMDPNDPRVQNLKEDLDQMLADQERVNENPSDQLAYRKLNESYQKFNEDLTHLMEDSIESINEKI